MLGVQYAKKSLFRNLSPSISLWGVCAVLVGLVINLVTNPLLHVLPHKVTYGGFEETVNIFSLDYAGDRV